jgi:hypothetical protein
MGISNFVGWPLLCRLRPVDFHYLIVGPCIICEKGCVDILKSFIEAVSGFMSN